MALLALPITGLEGTGDNIKVVRECGCKCNKLDIELEVRQVAHRT